MCLAGASRRCLARKRGTHSRLTHARGSARASRSAHGSRLQRKAHHLAPPSTPAESPRWLCANNKKEAAAAALRVLRGTDNVHAELRDIHAAALEAAALPAATPSDFFQRRSVAGPLGVSLSLMAFQQFTGINAVIFNATGIFANAGVQSAGIAALCVAVLQVVVTAVSVLLMDLAGRRPLLLAASVGMCASSVALGIALKEQAGMVAVGAVLTYIAAFSIGMGPIPWLIMSEARPCVRAPLFASCHR